MSSTRFKTLVTELTTEFATKKKWLEEQEQVIKTEQQKLFEEKEVMSKVEVANSDIVHLNVGGRIFATKRGTLRMVEGSVLDLLFSGRWEDRIDRDKDGYAFFDYDPDLFSIILRYLSALHTYGMSAAHLTIRPVPLVLEEEFRLMLDHLGLSEIVVPKYPFKWSPDFKSQNVTLLEDDTIALCDSDGRSMRDFVMSQFTYTGNVYRFKIIIEHLEEWMMIGICEESLTVSPGEDAVTKPNLYGWGSDGQVFVDGRESSKLGYPGAQLKTDQEIQLLLDCRYATLTLIVPIEDRYVEYKIPQLPQLKWRIVCLTYYGSSAINITSM